MHERSEKNSPLDVILYEIEMFRHCANTLPAKQDKAMASGDKAEYYLGIEGFLLHLRNLLAFFMSSNLRRTDLGITKPDLNLWGDGGQLQMNQYHDLVDLAQEINKLRKTKNGTLHVQISRFLQHCTTFRYTEARSWDVEGIFSDFNPLLIEFEKRFGK